MSRGVRALLVMLIALVTAGVDSYVVYRGIQRIPVREVEVASDPVVVAAKSLPVGALVGAADVRIVAWPRRNPLPGSFAKTDDVVGRGLLAPVLENEPITTSKLAAKEAGSGIAPTIPIGMRAISVKVNEVIGVAGFIVPGAHVDLVATTNVDNDTAARIVVSNLQVLTAGTRYDQQQTQDGKTIPATVVTLLATPEDAERIALAATDGKIQLALRNPLDIAPTTTPGVRRTSLMRPPSPPPVERTYKGRTMVVAAPPPPPPPPPYMVETIRGAKRTTEEVRK
jgi:pilus assembly protein CpaB